MSPVDFSTAGRVRSRKALSGLVSRPSGCRMDFSYSSLLLKGKGTAGVVYLAALRSHFSLMTTCFSAASRRAAAAFALSLRPENRQMVQ